MQFWNVAEVGGVLRALGALGATWDGGLSCKQIAHYYCMPVCMYLGVILWFIIIYIYTMSADASSFSISPCEIVFILDM